MALINISPCNSLDDVRENIDRINRSIVELIAERGEYVKQAASFKKTTTDVKAPARVEQVISKAKTMAGETGASPVVVEKVYHAMVDAFITLELEKHGDLNS